MVSRRRSGTVNILADKLSRTMRPKSRGNGRLDTRETELMLYILSQGMRTLLAGSLLCVLLTRNDLFREHDHTIPGFNLPEGLIVDYTDQGVLWDPIQSAYAYSYDATTQTFTPYDESYPVNWLYFNGQWGDDQLPNQTEIFGQVKYSAGPNGPKFKKLVREEVCPSSPCIVLPFRTWKEK